MTTLPAAAYPPQPHILSHVRDASRRKSGLRGAWSWPSLVGANPFDGLQLQQNAAASKGVLRGKLTALSPGVHTIFGRGTRVNIRRRELSLSLANNRARANNRKSELGN